MKQPFDELSKHLANGVSRREALRRFFVAVGATIAGLFTGRPALAGGNAVCVAFCRSQGLSGREFGKCVSASAHCPPGQCAYCVNNGSCYCMPV